MIPRDDRATCWPHLPRVPGVGHIVWYYCDEIQGGDCDEDNVCAGGRDEPS